MKEYLQELWSRILVFLRFEKPISQSGNLTNDDLFNAKKREDEKRLNQILDKINSKGMNALSSSEKTFLKKQSR